MDSQTTGARALAAFDQMWEDIKSHYEFYEFLSNAENAKSFIEENPDSAPLLMARACNIITARIIADNISYLMEEV